MDFFKSLGSLLFTGLALVSMFAGIMNDAILLGFIGAGICFFISYKILNSVSSETWKAVSEAEKQKKHQKMNGGYKCPSCGKHAGHEFYSPDVPTCCNIHFISYLRHFFILRCTMLLPFTLPF